MNPPSPEMWGPPSHTSEYVDPGVYPPAPHGKPLREGEIGEVFEWQVHPAVDCPVFPVEFAKTTGEVEERRKIRTSATAKLRLVITRD